MIYIGIDGYHAQNYFTISATSYPHKRIVRITKFQRNGMIRKDFMLQNSSRLCYEVSPIDYIKIQKLWKSGDKETQDLAIQLIKNGKSKAICEIFSKT